MDEGRLVALIPPCLLCGRLWWPLEAEHWKAYLTADDPPEVVFCCPECFEREFSAPTEPSE